MKILLMGNPNVGKSALFHRLTGVNVIASNYPGTTVEFTRGYIGFGKKRAELVDVPGAYTLDPTNKAEEVAVEILKEGDLVINVADATNLERNLYLTLQLLERKAPVIVALNMWDETEHTGVKIDEKGLEELLGVPVVPTVAIAGRGVKELVDRLSEARTNTLEHTDEERWVEIGRIIGQVQRVVHRHHTPLERLGDASVAPLTGILIAIAIMFLTFEAIRLIGEGLIGYVFEPLFGLYTPLVMELSHFLGPGFLHGILVGTLIEGKIDYMQSMGLLTTGIYVPIAAVLPYIFAFYLILSFLEDSGYLPRLAVLTDSLMHRIGLHGFAIIPTLLGLGCNVPGALSTRVLETRRERFIAATLMAIAVPCMAQIAMVFGLVGGQGIKGLGTVFLTLFMVWLALGMLLNRILKGESPEIFMEIPPYRIPYWTGLVKKLWMRIRGFITGAVPFVLLGVLLVNILYISGVIEFIGKIAAPIVTGLLGLPKEAVGVLIIGFLRKDVAVGMLVPLGLSLEQLVRASVILAMYFPCVATFAILVRELGVRDMAKSAGIMIGVTLLVGGLLNLLW